MKATVVVLAIGSSIYDVIPEGEGRLTKQKIKRFWGDFQGLVVKGGKEVKYFEKWSFKLWMTP